MLWCAIKVCNPLVFPPTCRTYLLRSHPDTLAKLFRNHMSHPDTLDTITPPPGLGTQRTQVAPILEHLKDQVRERIQPARTMLEKPRGGKDKTAILNLLTNLRCMARLLEWRRASRRQAFA